MIKKFSAFLLLAGLIACNNTTMNNNKVLVTTTKGTIEGIKDSESNLSFFFGVPYAKPPLGDLRWKDPQELDNWDGIKKTKNFANRAVQINVYGDMIYRSDTTSEDCLYLNIWTPEANNEKKLPVLVYFHGGGLIAGTGNEPRYDGAAMAKKGIVVVTVNYRLNVFGFLAHPELSAESPYKASGNYGLLDQAAALKWVNENIAAFGGNKSKVTIAGESAGSVSVSMHMVSPLSKNLIAGAIGQSGAAVNPTLFPKPLKQCELEGIKFMEESACKSIAELRKLGTKEIFDLYLKSSNQRFSTAIDNYFIHKTLPETFVEKGQAQIPLLLGWTSAELPAVVFMQGKPMQKDNFVSKVKDAYPKYFSEVLKHYPFANEKEIEQSATNIASDRFIAYSTWKWFDLHRNYSEQPIYRYYFDQIKPNTDGLIGAPHASDIEYLLGNTYLITDVKWTQNDTKTSETALNYFANFIISGNPNGKNLPAWENANSKAENIPVMNIKAESELEQKNDSRYFLLDKIYENNK